MRVWVFGTLRQLASGKEFEVELTGGTVRDLLEVLRTGQPALASRILDDQGHLESSVSVLVNGRNVRFLEGFETPVSDSDRIAIFPAVGGG